MLASCDGLTGVARKQPGSAAAIAALEPDFFNHMVLALDDCFPHRSRIIEGKDGNPLNEVRIFCDSIRANGALLLCEKVI